MRFNPPHAAGAPSTGIRFYGRRVFRALRAVIATTTQTGRWPGPSPGVLRRLAGKHRTCAARPWSRGVSAQPFVVMTGDDSRCPLCASRDAPALWRDDCCRVVAAGDRDHPGFLRVVWHDHVREMTDLDPGDRAHLMRVVWAVEKALRTRLAPAKINLASLGNQVPHLHWHVIARFADDAHFPDPVWAARRRDGVVREVDMREFSAVLAAALAGSAASG